MLLVPLTTLKGHLLPPAAVSRTDKDTPISLIGKGVAIAFERFCNRKFERATGATFKAPADCQFVCVDRYPIETLTSVTLLAASGDDSSDISADVSRTDKDAGLISFGALVPGGRDDQLVITFTGGWWIDPGSGSAPSGSTELPDDIKTAFVMQVRAICESEGLFGTQAAGDAKDKVTVLGREIDLLPMVKTILLQYRRFN